MTTTTTVQELLLARHLCYPVQTTSVFLLVKTFLLFTDCSGVDALYKLTLYLLTYLILLLLLEKVGLGDRTRLRKTVK